MRISTNNIGNYALNFKPANVNNVQKTQADLSKNIDVNKSEKEFFSNLYPDKRNEIINYHFYGRRGSLSGVSVGQNIDRKI